MTPKYLRYLTRGLQGVLGVQNIMRIRLLFGIYYNISSITVITLAARLYCVCVFSLVVLHNSKTFNFKEVWKVFTFRSFYMLVQYSVTIIINLFFEGERIFTFATKLKKVDDELRVMIYDEIPISRIIFLFVLSHKLFLINGLHVFNCNLNSLLQILAISIFQLGTSLCNFTRIMMFEWLYNRMKILRKRIKRNLSAYQRFKGEKEFVQNLKTGMVIYKNLVDTVHVTDTPMKMLVGFTIQHYIILIQYII